MASHRVLTRERLLLLACACCASTSSAAAATLPGFSQLGGWVYVDRNNDGHLAFFNEPNPEFAIGGVVVSLFSTVGNVETLAASMQSDDFGRYLFENINPGSYVLRETPPIEFVDGIDTVGILQSLNGQPLPGGASAGTATDNAFLGIVLLADVAGEFYNFGERGLAAGFASKRFLFANPPGTTPPPPPPGEPPFPEPTSLMLASLAVCGASLARRRFARR